MIERVQSTPVSPVVSIRVVTGRATARYVFIAYTTTEQIDARTRISRLIRHPINLEWA